ncbi:MAG: hypothetical protein JJU31_10510 [Wenzhouxiangella sp.]|nr:hypothetical protein [Wenzhouxiangella sp.]MCH8477588.1 hypothetical protein [Wenzhouxiangella sp.]
MVPRWYWAVAVIALLWMLFGALAFVMDPLTSDETLAAMSEAERELFLARPTWLFVVYGAAVFAGLAGAIGLVLRRGWAVHAFLVSLVFVIVQFVYVLFVMDAIGRIGVAAALPFPLLIFAIGAGLLWFSLMARSRGWLRV